MKWQFQKFRSWSEIASEMLEFYTFFFGNNVFVFVIIVDILFVFVFCICMVCMLFVFVFVFVFVYPVLEIMDKEGDGDFQWAQFRLSCLSPCHPVSTFSSFPSIASYLYLYLYFYVFVFVTPCPHVPYFLTDHFKTGLLLDTSNNSWFCSQPYIYI